MTISTMTDNIWNDSLHPRRD